MRRKSERTKPQTSPEKTPARRSRRGRKSPSKTPEPDHKQKEEEDGDENMERDSSSDRSSVGRTPKGRKKASRSAKSSDEQEKEYKSSRSRRRKIIKSDELENIEEDENGENDVKRLTTPVQPSEEVVYIVEVEDTPPKTMENEEVAEQTTDSTELIAAQTDNIREGEVSEAVEEVMVIPVSDGQQNDNEEEADEVESTEPSKSPELVETASPPSKSPSPSPTRKGLSKSSSPNSRSRESSRSTSPPVEKVEAEEPAILEVEDDEVSVREVSPVKEVEPEKEEQENIIQKPTPEPIRNQKELQIKETPRRTVEPEVQIHVEQESKRKSKSKEPDNIHIKDRTPERKRTKEVSSSKQPEEKKSQSQPIRKRKWLSRKKSESKPVLAISTDSLKNLISDVKPVPLCDVKLDSSPEREEIEEPEDRPKPIKSRERVKREPSTEEAEREIQPKARKNSTTEHPSISSNRKISIMSEDSNYVQRTPSPPKHNSCNILYITNLVRPFTVLQLKGLLARTGKIMENGFWIDKIKSRCYVKYETEDEATETRHALHGVRWPTSNPKCLNVDFGTDTGMTKAIESTSEEGLKGIPDRGKDGKDFGWDKDRIEIDERDKEVTRPVREWDVGKKDGPLQERDREMDRSKDRLDRLGRKRSTEREYGRRRSRTPSPARKFKKKENDPPLRLLDDLFRKTKATPCIYWLPLTAEQIAVKEEMRRKHMAEHQRRMEEIKKQEEERERERKEKEKERDRERNEKDTKEREKNRSNERSNDRSNDRRKDRSRSRGDRGGNDRRRYR